MTKPSQDFALELQSNIKGLCRNPRIELVEILVSLVIPIVSLLHTSGRPKESFPFRGKIHQRLLQQAPLPPNLRKVVRDDDP